MRFLHEDIVKWIVDCAITEQVDFLNNQPTSFVKFNVSSIN